MAIRHIHTHTLHMANGTPPKLVVNSSEHTESRQNGKQHQNCKSRAFHFSSSLLLLINFVARKSSLSLSLPLQSYQLVFSCCLFSANSQLIATTVAAAASRQQAFFFFWKCQCCLYNSGGSDFCNLILLRQFTFVFFHFTVCLVLRQKVSFSLTSAYL